MSAQIRRTILHQQTTHEEGGQPLATPTLLVAAIAIIRNPWFGRGFVEDLKPETRTHGEEIGRLLTGMIIDVTGDRLEGYGKASLVGIGGETEHAQALTHTLWFGNQFRNAVQAKTYLAFANMRGGPGCPLVIPLMDKHDAGRRSHYQTIHLNIPDAPADDEIVVALGASVGGHPHHRIGNRYEDLKDMGHDVDNPAGI